MNKRSVFDWYVAFMTYAFGGWLYEVYIFAVNHKAGFVNRGVFFGPYLPVYGFGGLIIILCLLKLKNRKVKIWKIPVTPVVCFICILLITSAVELIASYLLEAFTGKWPWDYSYLPFNFQGRVAFKTSARFGVLGIIALYIVQPFLDKYLPKLRKPPASIIYQAVVGVVALVFLTDVVTKFAGLQ